MIPLPCDKCILQIVCSRACKDFYVYSIRLDRQIFKLGKYIHSKNGRRRKHIKTQQLKHYNAYIKKAVIFDNQRSKIWDRILGDIL